MRIAIVLLALWTVANLALTARVASRWDGEGHTGAMSGAADSALAAHAGSHETGDGHDTRSVVHLPPAARDAVLAEMRLMLGSVHGILDGISRSDTAAIRSAAAASGVVMAADPALEQIIPRAFLQQGMATHMAFDSLAAGAYGGTESATRALSAITAKCVACHAAFKIELKP